MSKPENENPEAVAQQEGEDVADNNIPRRQKRMELAIQAATALAIIGGIGITLATYYHKQSLIVWSVYFTLMMVALVPFLAWQKRILEPPQAAPPTASTAETPNPTQEPRADPPRQHTPPTPEQHSGDNQDVVETLIEYQGEGEVLLKKCLNNKLFDKQTFYGWQRKVNKYLKDEGYADFAKKFMTDKPLVPYDNPLNIFNAELTNLIHTRLDRLSKIISQIQGA